MHSPWLAGILSSAAALCQRLERLAATLCHSRACLWGAFLVLGIALTSIITLSFQHIPSGIRVGMIAPHDIKATRNYEIVDEEASGTAREEARASVLPVFDMDAALANAIAGRVRAGFQAERLALQGLPGQAPGGARPRGDAVRDIEALDRLRDTFEETLGASISRDALQALIADRFSAAAEATLIELIRRTMSQPLLSERATGESSGERGGLLRRIQESEDRPVSEAIEEIPISDIGNLPTVGDVLERLATAPELRSGFRDRATAAAVRELAGVLIAPNASLNVSETARRRELAASNAKNVIIKINAGEMIIREGSRFEPWHLKVLAGIRHDRRHGAYGQEFLGTLLLVLLLMALPFWLLERFFRRVRIERSDYVLMGLLGIAVLLLLRLAILLAPAVRETFFIAVESGALHYAAPIAGGAMVLRMFVGAELSFVFALVISTLAALFVETDVRYMVFCLVTSSAAIMAIGGVDRRSLIMRAGAITGIAGVAAVIGIDLIASASAGGFSFSQLAAECLFAFLGGIGCAVVAMIAAPLIESVSGYTSDIKLLELANLNHPLLRELIVRAPGTYHHSHVVGLLGEAAATAIGANALLVRVGAYYHDIGKLKKPLYFIENVKGGENRHERLTPHMSSLIVSAHVKDGVDLAADAGIPKSIISMIPQHHGTRRISFFYDKAKSQEDPELMRVDPKDFLYPGPKPQTREAAILMLADVAEAAVRALKEKSPTRIEQTVRKTIHDIFNESQLDECELTLRDLNEIGRAFERTLLGIYHLRIEYTKDLDHERPDSSEAGDSADADRPSQRPPAEASKS
jgi:cyclic-di-AMP phosphodiesterase PgpH